jgi:hypothetical protein
MIPTTYKLSQINNCRFLSGIDKYSNSPIDIFYDGVGYILLTRKAGETFPKQSLNRLATEMVPSLVGGDLSLYFKQIWKYFVDLSKTFAISFETNIDNIHEIHEYSYTAVSHFMYKRANSIAYGIILGDFLVDTDIEYEYITSHPLVCGLVDTLNKQIVGAVPYIIEAVVPKGDRVHRFLIDIDNADYIKFAESSIRQLSRRYYLEKERSPNWSYQCNRCFHKGRCIAYRESREILRRPCSATI